MNVILDASAGVTLAATRQHARLRAVLHDAEHVLAPDLYDFEVTNALWKYARFGGWNDDQTSTVLSLALDLVGERVPGASLCVEALALAKHHNHPAYDMFYLSLARRHDALLATTDMKLIKLAQQVGVRVDLALLDSAK